MGSRRRRARRNAALNGRAFPSFCTAHAPKRVVDPAEASSSCHCKVKRRSHVWTYGHFRAHKRGAVREAHRPVRRRLASAGVRGLLALILALAASAPPLPAPDAALSHAPAPLAADFARTTRRLRTTGWDGE